MCGSRVDHDRSIGQSGSHLTPMHAGHTSIGVSMGGLDDDFAIMMHDDELGTSSKLDSASSKGSVRSKLLKSALKA